MRSIRTPILTFLAALIFIGASAWATKITKKDGTVLEGTAIRQPNGYWVKTADGDSQIVSDDDIASVSDDTAPPAGDQTNGNLPGMPGQSPFFIAAHNHAEDCETAAAAFAVWEDFIDKNPDSPDLDQAKTELARWKTLADQGAQKINGKWIGGDDLQKILDQSDALNRQATEMFEQKQTLKAIDTLKESLRVYPNSFLANYLMGDMSMFQKDYVTAERFYHQAVHLEPKSAEAVNNLAVSSLFQRHFEEGITEFHEACQIEDSRTLAQNLVTALALAPQGVRTSARMHDAVATANLLSAKYQIDGPSPDFILIPPPLTKGDAGEGTQIPSGRWAWSGTGFFLTEDGLILTNRHVAKDSKSLTVVMNDGSQLVATVVAIDDAQDLALLRVQPKTKSPFVSLSPADVPQEGADCVVMGFPMIDRLGADIKITRGIVSSASQDQGNGADILTDAKVNPGNSGGPILDKFGNLIAIVSMKSVATATEDSYGIGISAGHIRTFLAKNRITLTPSADQQPLSTEDIVTRIKPATVCILATQ